MDMSGYGYTCSAGETWDGIALLIWGNERYAADLIAANPQFSDRMMFAGGELLYLPVVVIPEDEDSALPVTAPWKEA